MKTIIRILAVLSALSLLACSKDSINNFPKVITDFPTIEVECDVDAPVVEVDPETKVYGYVADPENNPGKHTIKWKKGDQISMFSIVYSNTDAAPKGTILNFSNLRSNLLYADGSKTFGMNIPDLKAYYGSSSGVTTYMCAIYPAITFSDIQATFVSETALNVTATPSGLIIPDIQDGTGWKYSIFISRSALFTAATNNPVAGGMTFNLLSTLLRLKINTTKNITKVVLTNTTGFMTGNVESITMNSFHYATDIQKNSSLAGCPGKTLTIETGDVLPNDLYFAIRELREGTDFTFTFTAEDGTETTRSFSNPVGYDNRKFKKVLSLGEITLDDWH